MITARHQLVADYCNDRLTRGEVIRSSARNFRSYLDVWHDHAGPIDQWTEAVATAWVHDMVLRPGTRLNRLNRLRQYVAWLVRQGILERDLTVDIVAPNVPPPNPRDLSPAEVGQVLRACTDDRTLLILLLMVHCGMRSVDVSRALVEDIDMRTRMIAVRAKGGGGAVTHHSAVPSEAWRALAAWLVTLGRRAGPLFANERRLSPSPISAGRISKLAYAPIRAAGLKVAAFDGVSPHACRHSCAQHMLDGGADIRQVQAQLGHRHQATTEWYLRRRPEGLADAAEGRSYMEAA